MERRPTLKYEAKLLIHCLLPPDEKIELFIRGNADAADVLSRLGLSPAEYRLYLGDFPLKEGTPLKELGIKHHTILRVENR